MVTLSEMRTIGGMNVTVSARMVLRRPAPSMPQMAMARRMDGKAYSTSIDRMITVLTIEPAKPATTPRVPPIVSARNSGTTPQTRASRPR